MPYDGRAIANHFIELAHADDRLLSKLEIQKQVFFAHGWHLALLQAPLVSQKFEAWEYGPVLRVVYEAFKGEGSRIIRKQAFNYDPLNNEYYLAKAKFTPEERIFLFQVYSYYSKYNGIELSLLTHEAESPWDKVWNNIDGDLRLGMRISNDEIATFFKSYMAKPNHPITRWFYSKTSMIEPSEGG